jgi:hypothetical protein
LTKGKGEKNGGKKREGKKGEILGSDKTEEENERKE